MQLNVRNHASTKSIAAAFICFMSGNSEELAKLQKFALITVVVAALIMPVYIFAFSPTAYAAINCGDPANNHCYAVMEWQGAMSGSTTDIAVQHMYCFKAGCYFIDNEMWLKDTSSSSCVHNQWGNCWVEAGYLVDKGQCECYFWADVRPVDGNNFNLHYASSIHVNDYGHSVRVSIYQQGSNTFAVSLAIQGSCNNCTSNQFYNSIDNSMAPDYIWMGQEFAATIPSNSDAHAERADYINNYYYAAGKWWPQGVGNGPGAAASSPPYGGWVNGVVGGPTGGDYYTYCC